MPWAIFRHRSIISLHIIRNYWKNSCFRRWCKRRQDNGQENEPVYRSQPGYERHAGETRPENVGVDEDEGKHRQDRRERSLHDRDGDLLQRFLHRARPGVAAAARVEVRVRDVGGEVDGQAHAADDDGQGRRVERDVGQEAGQAEDAGDDGRDGEPDPEGAAPVGEQGDGDDDHGEDGDAD